MSNNISIKTRAIGGFDKKQVDEYLNSLAEEYEKSVSKEDIAKLRDEIAELKKSLREKDKELSELKEMLDGFDKGISPILTISAARRRNLPTLITRWFALPMKPASI